MTGVLVLSKLIPSMALSTAVASRLVLIVDVNWPLWTNILSTLSNHAAFVPLREMLLTSDTADTSSESLIVDVNCPL